MKKDEKCKECVFENERVSSSVCTACLGSENRIGFWIKGRIRREREKKTKQKKIFKNVTGDEKVPNGVCIDCIYEEYDSDSLPCIDCLEGEKKLIHKENVSHPAHYTAGEIECIDAIQAALTPEEFRGFCKGNALKYVWREQLKGGAEDIEKAAWYLDKLIEVKK